MPANLQNSAVATGLKISFHSNPKECSSYRTIALISHDRKGNAQNPPSESSIVCELGTSRYSSCI